MMTFRAMPAFAAWQHQGAHPGFEVSYFRSHDDGIRMRGCTTAVEEGVPWVVEYDISLDAHWLNTRAILRSLDADDDRTIVLEQPEPGRWLVDGEQAALLDGIFDVDLEASSLTNMMPIHRIQFTGDRPMDAPAAYVRADLTVERLEQTSRSNASNRPIGSSTQPTVAIVLTTPLHLPIFEPNLFTMHRD